MFGQMAAPQKGVLTAQRMLNSRTTFSGLLSFLYHAVAF